MSTLSILPKHYDIAFIIEKAGVVNHYGYETKDDGIHFRYLVDDYDAVQSAITSYPVDYRARMVPNMLATVAHLRDERVLGFTFQGMPISLNDKTIANLTAATVGLERNPDVASINWAINAETFVELPREVVLAMADAAFRHVQRCFDAQKIIAQEIMTAPDIEVLRAMDLHDHAAWPAKD